MCKGILLPIIIMNIFMSLGVNAKKIEISDEYLGKQEIFLTPNKESLDYDYITGAIEKKVVGFTIYTTRKESRVGCVFLKIRKFEFHKKLAKNSNNYVIEHVDSYRFNGFLNKDVIEVSHEEWAYSDTIHNPDKYNEFQKSLSKIISEETLQDDLMDIYEKYKYGFFDVSQKKPQNKKNESWLMGLQSVGVEVLLSRRYGNKIETSMVTN